MPQRRKITAKEAAERLGSSERTIRRIAAEPRLSYEAARKARGEQILRWREDGLLWREIAERLNVSINAAQKAGEYAKKREHSDG
ncbi:replication protein RepB [Subtercola boreus]|uniref:replication protein RepB n=1 Tax=Subtercola boreus TaxID=120213 RepID=UPI000E2F32E2|nr:replication protein RepB [Subtercola boreus]